MAAGDYDVAVNTSEVNRALRALDRDLQRETRREMAKLSREVRDEIRSDVPRGPKEGGHTFRAVTSGTRGLVPVVRLNRGYRPYTGWIFFGGRRPRDRQPRRVAGDGPFYEGIAKARPEAVKRARDVLDDAIRKAGLD